MIFDLEDTLTYVSDKLEGAHAFIPVVTQDKQNKKLGLFFRPYLKECVTKLKALDCEVVVWTSGQSDYSNKIINFIDPDSELFDMRLFRDQCYISPKGLYIKDLRMINRDLDKCIIVDDHAYSFGFQLDNGVLILPFTGEETDTEMLTLGEYLTYLMRFADFRSVNRKHFKYDAFEKENNMDHLMKLISKG